VYDAGWLLHKRVRHAHLWIQAPTHNPYLCRPRSTFPPMTTGTIAGILELIRTTSTPGWVEKGRNDESTVLHSVKRGSRSRRALRLLWRTPPGYAQFKAGMVVGVFAAGRHEHRTEPVSGLPPAPPGPSHWSHRQRPHVTGHQIRKLPHRLASSLSTIDDTREGQHQASSLVYPSRQAWAYGR
jgi:hypothetical protein